MAQTQFHLLKTRRFLPLFITQFFNAFNDNVFKNGFVILITYKSVQNLMPEQTLIAVIGGIFILPFFLFSATAGLIADKYEKSQLIRIIKAAEIFFMILASLGFYYNNLFLLMTTLFFLGTHSTFFSPIKYAILPSLLQKHELIGGNGLIEAGTFIAILLGQILGASLILAPHGIVLINLALLTIAVLGFASCLFIPRVEPAKTDLSISLNIGLETWRIIQFTKSKHDIFLGILGISWFWFVGATLLTQLPTFTKEILGGSASIFTLFLTVFSIGVGIGSLLCNKLLKGKISARYVPAAMIAMSVFILDIYFTSSKMVVANLPLLSLQEFLVSLTNLHILADIFLIAVCGGLFVVPLYALLQERSEESVRSRVIACNNIINALFMVVSALFIMFMTSLKYTIPQLFVVIAIFTIFVAIYIGKYLPIAQAENHF